MGVLTQISVVAPPQPLPVPRRVALLPVADDRPAVTFVSWQPRA